MTRLNVGGPARHALLLTRSLAPEYETTLAVGTPDASEGEMLDPGVRIERVPLVRPVRPATDAQALVAVRQLMGHLRPAIVHTHMAKAGTVGRMAALTMRPRPRVVHTFHGHVLDGYFGPRTQRVFVQAERLLARHTDSLVAVSPEIRDQLLDLGIGRRSQYSVISVGLDLQPFLDVAEPTGHLRARLGLDLDTPLVGSVGRLVPIKNNEMLLRAVQPLSSVHVVFVGDGELRSRVEAVAAELGVADRVHVTGWCDDIADAIGDLDLVALTSRNEGTPLALIEAAAAGRAVVSTDVGGVRSVVVDEVTGLLIPPGDVARLTSTMGRLLSDPACRRRMGLAGRQYVEHRYGQRRLLDEVRSLYRDLLA